MSPSNKLTSAALSSASSLISLQLFSRLTTFILNQALVRLATPQTYGTVSVQLEPVLNTILFLSRDGFRNALLRADDVGGKEKRRESKDKDRDRELRLSNVALLPIYLGVPVTLVTITAYYMSASEAVKAQPCFTPVVVLYALAALVELISEPMHIRSVQALDPRTRVRAEGAAVIVRTIITLGTLAYDKFFPSSNTSAHLGLLAFALGQTAYAWTLLFMFSGTYRSLVSYKLQRPSRLESTKGWFDESLLKVSSAMTAQGILKHILTEGDKLIVSRISPLKDQGGYAVANNYGSLVARVFFQPIEESSRLYFSKTLSSSDKQTDTAQASSNNAASDALNTLRNILLFYTHMSLLLVSIAPSYLRLVLCAVLPGRYLHTSAPRVLSAWIWYIPVLAINGVLEAFVSSVATPRDLSNQSRWMAFFSVTYVVATVILYKNTNLGDTAVVYANTANLVARIIYCGSFVSSYLNRANVRSSSGHQVHFSWRDTLPKVPVLLAFFVSAVITRESAKRSGVHAYLEMSGLRVLLNKPCLIHLGVGVTCGLICLGVCAIAEREHSIRLITAIKSRVGRRKSKVE